MRIAGWLLVAGALALSGSAAWAQVGPVVDAPPPPCQETQPAAAVAAWTKPATSVASAHDAAEAKTHLLPIGARATLKLARKDTVKLPVTPGGAPQPKEYIYAGLAGFTVPKDGTYRVITGEGMRIDVVADNAIVKSTAFGKGVACDGKHVDFSLKAGTAMLQLAGAPYDSVDVLIVPAP
jgi:hypothetical protein